jgi:hypothetical protein
MTRCVTLPPKSDALAVIGWKVMGSPARLASGAARVAPPVTVSLMVVAMAATAAGCKGRDESSAAASAESEASVAAPASAGAGTDGEDETLLARRDTLLATRLELRSKRAELAERREAIREKGGDTSAVDRETDELSAREGAVAAEEKSLLDKLLSERQAMVSALAGARSGGGVPGREAAVAARERDLSRREQKLAEREAQLATREEGLASKWQAECAAAPATIVEAAFPRGTRYGKRDVEPLLARARSEMNRKGLLRSDLPEPVRDLETEATRAMEKGDYGQARLAAAQLHGTVRVIKVDKAFIADKIRRLNAVLKGARLTPPVEQLFREATRNVADGNFPSANRKLNRIHSAID